MRRRDFLKLAGGLAAGATAVGARSTPTTIHHGHGSTSTSQSSTTSTTQVSSTSVPAPVMPRDRLELGSSLQGRLARPSSPGYSVTVTCDAVHHSDLFWALRGGGGGSFGVVTRFSFLTHPIGTLGLFTLVWPWSSAAATTSAWQDWAPEAPDELWSNCLLVADQSTPAGEAPAARVTCVYVGSQAALQTLVDELVSEVGASPFTTFVGSATYLDTMLIEGGCADDSVNECHLPSQNPVGLLDRAPFVAKSNIVDSKLSAAGIATLLDAVEQRQASPVLSGGGFVLDAAGGAINRVAPDATAYVHRRSLAMLQYSASWVDSSPPSVVAANRQWIETAWRLMRPYVSSGACSNYADPDLVDWEQAYWGSNFTKLTEVKRAYDPGNVFHFPQSIPLG